MRALGRLFAARPSVQTLRGRGGSEEPHVATAWRPRNRRVYVAIVALCLLKSVAGPRYDALNEQIRVMAMGLCRPKGQGKGPPLPPKGKGKGVGKAKGLGALAQDLQPQIGRVEGEVDPFKAIVGSSWL